MRNLWLLIIFVLVVPISCGIESKQASPTASESLPSVTTNAEQAEMPTQESEPTEVPPTATPVSKFVACDIVTATWVEMPQGTTVMTFGPSPQEMDYHIIVEVGEIYSVVTYFDGSKERTFEDYELLLAGETADGIAVIPALRQCDQTLYMNPEFLVFTDLEI